MRLWSIENIRYRRKTIDRGVILGRRKYKSELARTQKPCQLFEGTFRISFRTPHKRHFAVFVPASELVKGKTLTWLHYDQDTGKTLETELLLTEVSRYHVCYDVLKEEERIFRKRRTVRELLKAPHSAFGLTANPFCVGRHEDSGITAPEVIVWNTRWFWKKSNYCFLWEPDHKKRAGTPFKRVYPEAIKGETFLFDFESYDLLTGRKLDQFVGDVRHEHFRHGLKPAPLWQEAR